MVPSSIDLIFSGGSRARPAAWNTSQMATRPRTRTFCRRSDIAQVAVRHGFGYLLRAAQVRTQRLAVDEPRRGRPPMRLSARNAAGTCARCSTSSARRSSVRTAAPRPGPTSRRLYIVVELRGLQDDVRPFPFAQVGEVGSRRKLCSTIEQAFPELRPGADRGGLDRSEAPRDAPERRPGCGPGAAAERAAPDRVGPRASLPGRADDQGARPRARLHRRRGARRRVCAQHPPQELDYKLQARHADHFRRNFRGSEAGRGAEV